MSILDIEKIANLIAKNILAEEFSEEKKQSATSDEINRRGVRADTKHAKPTDEAEDEEESQKSNRDDIEPKTIPDTSGKQEKEKKKAIKFSVKPEVEKTSEIDVEDIKKQINGIRAGKSLKDEEVSSQLEDYYKRLGAGEEKSLYIFLNSIASILTGGGEGESVPQPSKQDIEINIKAEPAKSAPRSQNRMQAPKSSEPDNQTPIVVGESADNYKSKMMVLESLTADDDHRCISGRVVKFGSKECVKDLMKRIENAEYERNSCSSGSADRASLNGVLKYLRGKLRKAEKLLNVF
jgi:hypothetical protein